MVEAIALEQAIKRDERPDAYPLMLRKLSYKTIAVEPKASFIKQLQLIIQIKSYPINLAYRG